ncbi:DUF2125 domain-containing protein [Rhodobacteraceae bacterium D3-12]|nr:DUF2125 domain-containing protein [Rhodobacteraceae bacterium D3-12]
MKRLLVIVIIIMTCWSVYWYVAMRGAKSGFESWFEARRAAGWQAEYSALEINGFPNRIDATFDKPVLADPATGLAWEAAFLQIFALSYKPNHVIMVWPKSQRLSTPLTHYNIASEDMRASVVMAPETSLPFERANLVAQAMAVTTKAGITTLGGVQVAASRLEGADSEYRLSANIDGLAPALSGPLTLRTGGALPRQLEALRVDATMKFDRPWDLSTIETGRPQPTRLKLRLAEAKWGDLELAMAGAVEIGVDGHLSGRITLKARNWRDIITILRQMNAVPDTWIDPLEQGLSLAAQLSGNQETLDLPLDFKNGQMALGPIPLGPAPVIRLR